MRGRRYFSLHGYLRGGEIPSPLPLSAPPPPKKKIRTRAARCSRPVPAGEMSCPRRPGVWMLWRLALALELLATAGGLRQAVHWNSSNARLARGDHSVQVNINDYLDIFCPHYPPSTPPESTESFTLYLVSAEGYRRCQESRGAFKRWECSRPFAPHGPVRFSEKIQLFTPFSLGFEFQPGQEYYYISVPSEESPPGQRCLRLRVSVCCATTTGSTSHVRRGTPAPRSAAISVMKSSATLLLLLLTCLWVSWSTIPPC